MYCILNFKKQNLIFSLFFFFVFCVTRGKAGLNWDSRFQVDVNQYISVEASVNHSRRGPVFTPVRTWVTSWVSRILLMRCGYSACMIFAWFFYGTGCHSGYDLTRVMKPPPHFSFSKPKPLHPSVICPPPCWEGGCISDVKIYSADNV